MPPLSLERPSPLTSFFAGDPVAVEATCASGLLEALGLPARGAGALALAPRVTLVHALAPDAGSLAVRWVRLVPPADLGAGVADCAVALTGPLREAGRALRLAGRLRAVLADPRMVEAAAGARRSEGLVRAGGARTVRGRGAGLAGDGGGRRSYGGSPGARGG